MKPHNSLFLLFLLLPLNLFLLSAKLLLDRVEGAEAVFFKPFNVTYDHRALVIDGKRRILTSAGIHYPRATPQMWPDLISKSKEGGADVIQTYVFWNAHEPERGQYNFEGRYDLVKFVKLVGSSGLFLHLRIGPYVCAEWNFGGFPIWLRDVPGIEFRTNNAPFKEEMERFVKKIVILMQEEMLFSWQGGPIIMLQIENEYGNVERSYGQSGQEYVKWVANMALGLGAGVPWVMCQQSDAPESIINACNGFYCDGFRPNSRSKPALWTEDWDGCEIIYYKCAFHQDVSSSNSNDYIADFISGFASWGGRLPHRPAEDLAFAVARFFQRGGSFQNYYMYFGGTNFGRTSGGPFYITSYDYDAPLDEYGLLSQPKWGHLKDLHAAIKLCEKALVTSDSPHYIKLGPKQEAHVYNGNGYNEGTNITWIKSLSVCSAFIANIDEHDSATVNFFGQHYSLPPWSVSILPDCKNVVFNTAKVSAQTSIKSISRDQPLLSNIFLHQKLNYQHNSYLATSWMYVPEPIDIWSDDSFTVQGILEHLNVTKDRSDYLWYFSRIYISDEDIAYWKQNNIKPSITIDSMRDVLRVFVNGELQGSVTGHWVKVLLPIQLLQGYNDMVLLSETVGLQNYGAFFERDGAGFRGQVKLTGLSDGDLDLYKLAWTYQVGLQGEGMRIFTIEENERAGWSYLTNANIPATFTWYKTYFDSPDGDDPVALDLGSMGKGQAWFNGHHLGRYWTAVAPKSGCQRTCDYRGPYNPEKCSMDCGKPTQSQYHVPRSWLKPSNNLLVIFEETGGDPFQISLKLRSSETICGLVSESHYPPIRKWSHPVSSISRIAITDLTPEMHLKCENGHVISSIEFSSYGTPQGPCENFKRSSCHAPKSIYVVTMACQGKNSCSVGVSNAVFGGDPCHGIVKTLAVQARCTPQVMGFASASK